jgi:hypothetical protein
MRGRERNVIGWMIILRRNLLDEWEIVEKGIDPVDYAFRFRNGKRASDEVKLDIDHYKNRFKAVSTCHGINSKSRRWAALLLIAPRAVPDYYIKDGDNKS